MKTKNNRAMPKLDSKIVLYIISSQLLFSNVMAGSKFSFSTGATYITGNYGGSDSTDVYYVPFTFKYKYEKLRLRLTIPYLEKTGPRNVIVGIGQIGKQASTIRTTETGLGDITAALRYNIYYNQAFKFSLDAEGKVNIGTADESKGLGTGKTDFSFRLGVYKVIDKLTPYVKGGYKVYGRSKLNDVFFVSTGLSYQVNSTVSAGFDYAWREKVSDSGAEKNLITGFSSQKLTKNWGLQEYIIKGFGRSTAAWGGGISISYGFDF